MKSIIPMFGLTLAAFVISLRAAESEVRKPVLDAEGRFHLYSAAAPVGAMPFSPYAIMPAEASPMIKLDPEYKVKPNPEGEKSGEGTCIKVSVTWAKPFWVGCAFLSGPDSPQWWGEDDRGRHYDFSALKKKKLVFFARGETAKERIKVKFGILGDKKYGDSTKFPAETGWLKLTTEWQKFELDLSKYRPSDLAKIANAFTFVVEKVQQDGAGDTVFYLDTITLE